MRARGFLMGGTAGRTTLNGEGLQHEDGHSHCSPPRPELHAVRPDLRARSGGDHPGRPAPHGEEQEDVFYYITMMNENYPTRPEAGQEEGI
jgi:pyruvate dehydrogenase E1 component